MPPVARSPGTGRGIMCWRLARIRRGSRILAVPKASGRAERPGLFEALALVRIEMELA